MKSNFFDRPQKSNNWSTMYVITIELINLLNYYKKVDYFQISQL